MKAFWRTHHLYHRPANSRASVSCTVPALRVPVRLPRHAGARHVARLWLVAVACLTGIPVASAQLPSITELKPPHVERVSITELGRVHAALASGPEVPLARTRNAVPRGTGLTIRFQPNSDAGAVPQSLWVDHAPEGVAHSSSGQTTLAVHSPGPRRVDLQVSVQTSDGRLLMATEQYTFDVLDVHIRDVRTDIVYPGAGADSPLDLNADGRIDAGDLSMFDSALGAVAADPAYVALADWDGTGSIDLLDQTRFQTAHAGWSGTARSQVQASGLALPAALGEVPAGGRPLPALVARAVTFPAGLEQWLVWSVDQVRVGAGPVVSSRIVNTGTHTLTAGLPAGAATDQRQLTSYRVKLYDPSRQRIFDPARDSIREGVNYSFRAITEPGGFEEHVRWSADTRHGNVAYDETSGAEFEVRYANTFGVADREQALYLQADNLFIEQNVSAQGEFPASLAHGLLNALDKLGTVIELEQDRSAGGRQVLTHIRDDFLPVYYQVLDFELNDKGLNGLMPFRDNSWLALLQIIDELLFTRTDAELNELVFVESELRLFVADMQFDADLGARIDAETDAAGNLVSSSWALKWLWNRSQAVLGCLAQGPGKIIHKLIGALHGAIHDGALDPVVAAASTRNVVEPVVDDGQLTERQIKAHAMLDELVQLSAAIVDGAGNSGGGRVVVTRVLDHSLPFVDLVLREALESSGNGHMIPFVDRGVGDSNVELLELLQITDSRLDALVYADVAMLPAANALLQAEPAIRQLIDAMEDADSGKLEPVPGAIMSTTAAATADFDPEKWLWDTAVGLIGCIPNIGALLEKLVGAGHDIAHMPDATPTPGDPIIIANQAVDDFAVHVVGLAGTPQRGRDLALHVRDNLLPAMLDVITMEVTDLGEPMLAERAALGIAAQQQRMTRLLEQSDDVLNAELYDAKHAVLALAETHVEVFGLQPGETGTATGAVAANAWSTLMRIVKCLSEGESVDAAALQVESSREVLADGDSKKSDKLIWVVEQIHGFLH